MAKTKVIAVANQKAGVGKSTTVYKATQQTAKAAQRTAQATARAARYGKMGDQARNPKDLPPHPVYPGAAVTATMWASWQKRTASFTP